MDWDSFKAQMPYSLVSQIAPALTEEAVFRFGIVHGAHYLGGLTIGVAAGSLPFGLLHLINVYLGIPVDFQQVFGIVVAGVLLSLLYLKMGLWAAIGCHYAWNALANPWVKAMHLDASSGMAQFEGAWLTSVAILVAIAMTWFVVPARRGYNSCNQTLEKAMRFIMTSMCHHWRIFLFIFSI